MFVLTDTQKTALAIAVVDAKGNAALIDGVPVWTSSDDAILAVTAAADGLSAVAVAVGPLGQAQVNVSADADLGAGVSAITGTLDVQVIAGAAVAVTIAAGAPEEQ